jgi:hypothetical protein
VEVRRGADWLCPIDEALRPRRSPTPRSRNRFAPVHVHGLWKPSVGSSVDDLGILTNRAVFVQYNVVGYLERGRCISTVGVNEKQKMGRLMFLADVLRPDW